VLIERSFEISQRFDVPGRLFLSLLMPTVLAERWLLPGVIDGSRMFLLEWGMITSLGEVVPLSACASRCTGPGPVAPALGFGGMLSAAKRG